MVKFKVLSLDFDWRELLGYHEKTTLATEMAARTKSTIILFVGISSTLLPLCCSLPNAGEGREYVKQATPYPVNATCIVNATATQCGEINLACVQAAETAADQLSVICCSSVRSSLYAARQGLGATGRHSLKDTTKSQGAVTLNFSTVLLSAVIAALPKIYLWFGRSR